MITFLNSLYIKFVMFIIRKLLTKYYSEKKYIKKYI